MNTKMLVVEQILDDLKIKDLENTDIFHEQIRQLRDQLEKKNFLIDGKEKYYSELIAYIKTIHFQDANEKKRAIKKMNDIEKAKVDLEKRVVFQQPSLGNVINEKEKI